MYRAIISLFFIMAFGSAQEFYKDPSKPVEERIDDLINRMTLEQKISMLGGTGFESVPNDSLDIPPLNMTDGPVGVRWGQATAFPASIVMASTWDPALIFKLGQAIAQEAKARGRNVLLAPCVNIQRVPHGGRNFESFGEDPYLAARMAVAYAQGVQSEKVMATVKHFAINNQENERFFIDVKVSERAMHEIYFPAFKAAVQEGGSWSVMAAYNRLNGQYCCANTWLLTTLLKKTWDFRGFVMSDWGAVHSAVPTAYAGLDIEMPTGRYLNVENLLGNVRSGVVSESIINDKIRRMLRAMIEIGIFDQVAVDSGSIDTPEHRLLARTVAREGMVLLKNRKNILPLSIEKIKSIAVFGPNAAEGRIGGGGSSSINPFYTVSPLQGIQNRVGDSVTVRFNSGIFASQRVQAIPSQYLQPPAGESDQPGLLAEYYNNPDFDSTVVIRRIDAQVNFDIATGSLDERLGPDNFSIRWRGRLLPPVNGDYELSISSDDGSRLYLNGEKVLDNWGQHAVVTMKDTFNLEAGKEYDIMVEYYERGGGSAMILGWERIDPDSLERIRALQKQKVLNLATSSDAAIIVVGLSNQIESEGFDRSTLDLPQEQINLITSITQANSNTVVILQSGAPVLMDKWIAQVPALLQSWYPGQEGGNAIADIIFGNVNPSGKLPVSWLKRWEDSPAYNNYPGKDGIVTYAEGIYVGYRHFDTRQIEPQFPFGYGLSYTDFNYKDLRVSASNISKTEQMQIHCTIENSGNMAGAEVVQLYIKDEKASVDRPEKELKGFQKVYLQPGEQKEITFKIDQNVLSFYDTITHSWVAEPGKFQVLIGSSSRNIRLQKRVELK
jgi:beta-glucosidase